MALDKGNPSLRSGGLLWHSKYEVHIVTSFTYVLHNINVRGASSCDDRILHLVVEVLNQFAWMFRPQLICQLKEALLSEKMLEIRKKQLRERFHYFYNRAKLLAVVYCPFFCYNKKKVLSYKSYLFVVWICTFVIKFVAQGWHNK